MCHHSYIMVYFVEKHNMEGQTPVICIAPIKTEEESSQGKYAQRKICLFNTDTLD